MRILICGRSGLGKTTLLVNLIDYQLRDQMDVFIIMSPTFCQETFNPIRNLFTPKTIFETVDQKALEKVCQSIITVRKSFLEKNLQPPRFCVIIDDCAGKSVIQGRRRGVFANFAVQSRHWETSLIVISQQPSCVDPNFRDNAEHVIAFPSEREEDILWLKKSYNTNFLDGLSMTNIIKEAWLGGRNDSEEWGQHFLYIYRQPRGKSRYFIDFNKEL